MSNICLTSPVKRSVNVMASSLFSPSFDLSSEYNTLASFEVRFVAAWVANSRLVRLEEKQVKSFIVNRY